MTSVNETISRQKNNSKTLAILMLIVFADLMAWGVFIPIAPTLFQPGGAFYIALPTENLRSIYYFFSIGIWGLGAFAGVPFFGDTSDIYGRKPVIVVSLLGLFLTIIWMVFSLYMQSPLSFVISRFVNGFFSATFFIAQAVAVDISNEKNMSRNIGLVISAAALSWVLGPIIPFLTGFWATVMHSSNSIYWPFFVMLVIVLLALILVVLYVPETLTEKKERSKFFIFKVFLNITFAFTDSRARLIYIPYIFRQFAWAMFLLYFPYFALRFFHVESVLAQSSLFLIGAIGFIIGVRIQNIWVAKKRSPVKLILVSNMLLLVTYGIYIFSAYIHNIWVYGLATFFAFMMNAILYLAVTGYGAPYFKPNERGSYFGAAGAIISLGFFLAVIFNLLANVSLYYPFVLIVIFSVLFTPLIGIFLKLKNFQKF